MVHKVTLFMVESEKSEKIPDLLLRIRACLESGKYLFSNHALLRKKERFLTIPKITQQVLRNGYHEKKKDQWDQTHNAWNYAIRGKTIDNEDLRVIVSFDENGMLIITVIRLE